MKTKFITLLLASLSVVIFAQIGINTDSPSSTYDIKINRNASGAIVNNNIHHGFLAPKISRAELTNNNVAYGSQQEGAIIYVNDISGGNIIGNRSNINRVGYYYFDGTLWQQIANIYNSNGTLTSDRRLNFNNFSINLGIASEGQYSEFSKNGLAISNSIGSRSSLILDILGSPNSRFAIINDNLNYSSLTASGSSAGIVISTNRTVEPSNIRFLTSTGNNAVGQDRIIISSNGNVNFGSFDGATEKLEILEGNFRIRFLPIHLATNAIYTTPLGGRSLTKNQTFTATRTVVADNNGVFGYVDGLPSIEPVIEVDLYSVDKDYVHSADIGTTKYTGISINVPPGSYKIDLNLGITLQGKKEYTPGDNFIRFRLSDSKNDMPVTSFTRDALHSKVVSQSFAFSQSRGTVAGSLSVKNNSSTNKTYYLHVDNAESVNKRLPFNIKMRSEESSIVLYPINLK